MTEDLKDMRRWVVYQVLTDRFAGPEGREIRGLSTTGPAYRWNQFAGGTYQGLQSRLSYLRNLGMTALWISPVVAQSILPAGPGKKEHHGYHGYWARDFEQPSRELGSEEELSRLLQACAQHDISPILDVVLNHSNPKYSSDRGDLYRNGKLFARYQDDPDSVFHHYGDLDQTQEYEPFQWENFDVWSLADLAQENTQVSEYLKRAHLRWIKMGFAGVRIDTALHVPASWLREWRDFIRKNAPDCRFFMGEWWNGGAGHKVVPGLARQSGMHITDFEFAEAVRGWLTGLNDLGPLKTCLELQDGFEDPDLKVNFLDNHDIPRLMNGLLSQGYNLQKARRRLVIGVALLMFWRGLPCVYYGTESALFTRRRARGKPWGQDPYNREPMRFSPVDEELTGMIRLFSRLRRETDLTEHRLVVVEEAADVWEIGRGRFRLQLDLGPEGEPSGASLWEEEKLLWRSVKDASTKDGNEMSTMDKVTI